MGTSTTAMRTSATTASQGRPSPRMRAPVTAPAAMVMTSTSGSVQGIAAPQLRQRRRATHDTSGRRSAPVTVARHNVQRLDSVKGSAASDRRV